MTFETHYPCPAEHDDHCPAGLVRWTKAAGKLFVRYECGAVRHLDTDVELVLHCEPQPHHEPDAAPGATLSDLGGVAP